jgi:predicted HTH transcriptional regulator
LGLETVVAFANTEGGSIFVGLDDHGTVSGTDRHLLRAYAKEHGSNIEALQNTYARLLEKIVLTGVRPRIVPEFSWIAAEGAWILEIRIPAVAHQAAYVDRSSECFIRRGSTNKRASPPEIEQIASRQVLPRVHPG